MRTPSSHRIGALIAASVRSTAESARARTEELSVSQPIATRVPATCRRDGVTHATRQVDRGNCYACLQLLLRHKRGASHTTLPHRGRSLQGTTIAAGSVRTCGRVGPLQGASHDRPSNHHSCNGRWDRAGKRATEFCARQRARCRIGKCAGDGCPAKTCRCELIGGSLRVLERSTGAPAGQSRPCRASGELRGEVDRWFDLGASTARQRHATKGVMS